ncbi:DoxX family protein [Gramella jeungdoensis]|uniref:DoxX family protein n=1 Tax=Gramella jeungdoensis TaxID=708091 RepID=A0ABT0YX06_9FLAO|nr:DoxX family protein [Gramella jeungdoensis]MCM8567992.1 DoxX family protein [Gramella jeungdoensis]
MNITTIFDQFHANIRRNRWAGYFTVFLRIALAYAFIFAGFVKVNGERFTSLSNNHPMGHYLEALFHTGYYYTFIGILQMLAGILLLIPRTALLGALIYFPIILNICILSLAVRFDGSILTSPLMVMANLYLICWDYHRWKFILPFKRSTIRQMLPDSNSNSREFPFKFFGGIFLSLAVTVSIIILVNLKALMPRNHISDCQAQCPESSDAVACNHFCECIHEEGGSLNQCLEKYGRTVQK